MRLFAFGFNMDHALRAGMRGLDRIFQPVADVMRLTDGHRRRHDEVEGDEGRAACLTRAQVMDVERAFGMPPRSPP